MLPFYQWRGNHVGCLADIFLVARPMVSSELLDGGRQSPWALKAPQQLIIFWKSHILWFVLFSYIRPAMADQQTNGDFQEKMMGELDLRLASSTSGGDFSP